jgi:hypothetical protein
MIEISQKPLGGKKGVILGLPLRRRQLLERWERPGQKIECHSADIHHQPWLMQIKADSELLNFNPFAWSRRSQHS